MSTIVTRAGKGSVLTHAELDANFTNLNTDKADAVKVNGPAFSAHPTTARLLLLAVRLEKLTLELKSLTLTTTLQVLDSPLP